MKRQDLVGYVLDASVDAVHTIAAAKDALSCTVPGNHRRQPSISGSRSLRRAKPVLILCGHVRMS